MIRWLIVVHLEPVHPQVLAASISNLDVAMQCHYSRRLEPVWVNADVFLDTYIFLVQMLAKSYQFICCLWAADHGLVALITIETVQLLHNYDSSFFFIRVASRWLLTCNKMRGMNSKNWPNVRLFNFERPLLLPTPHAILRINYLCRDGAVYRRSYEVCRYYNCVRLKYMPP